MPRASNDVASVAASWLAIAGLAAGVARAQTPATPPSAETQVRALEQSQVRAALAGDTKTLQQIFADD